MVPLINTTSMNRNNIGKNPLSSIVYRAETIKKTDITGRKTRNSSSLWSVIYTHNSG